MHSIGSSVQGGMVGSPSLGGDSSPFSEHQSPPVADRAVTGVAASKFWKKGSSSSSSPSSSSVSSSPAGKARGKTKAGTAVAARVRQRQISVSSSGGSSLGRAVDQLVVGGRLVGIPHSHGDASSAHSSLASPCCGGFLPFPPFKDDLEAEPEATKDPKETLRKLNAFLAGSGVKPDVTLMPDERKVVDAGLAALSHLSTPEKHHHGQELSRALVASAGVTLVVGEEHPTPRREGRIAAAIKHADGWYQGAWGAVVSACRGDLPTGPELIDWGHIDAPSATGGFHFCPPGHHSKHLLKWTHLNPETEVFTAAFSNPATPGRDKISTFFPSWISSLEELKDLLVAAEVVMEKEGNQLLLVSHPDHPPFYVHRYVRMEGFLVVSAFPVMFFGDLKKSGREIDILGIRYKIADIEQWIKTKEPEFSCARGVVYDIAPFIGNPAVPKGIYVKESRLKL